MRDIFISYASQDKKKAGLLAEVLEQQGWSVWWDRKIPPGKSFDEVIAEALDAAKCVVVLWSKYSVKSNWVKEEAAMASKRKILIPALIDDVGIPLGFGRIHAAHLVGWQGTATEPNAKELIESIASLVSYPKVDKPKPDLKPLVDKYDETKPQKIATKVVDKKADLQKCPEDEIGTKPIIIEKTKKKPIEQPPNKNKAEEEKRHKSKEQQDATTQSTAKKRSRLLWLLPAIIVPFIIGIVVLILVKERDVPKTRVVDIAREEAEAKAMAEEEARAREEAEAKAMVEEEARAREEVEAGEKKVLTEKLEKQLCSLLVRSDPSSADIYIDGSFSGTTPDTLNSIASGRHKVEVKKDGYKVWSKRVKVKAGEETSAFARLKYAVPEVKTKVKTDVTESDSEWSMLPEGWYEL